MPNLTNLAQDALTQIEAIARAAKDELARRQRTGPDALANINIMNDTFTVQEFARRSQDGLKSCLALTTEPAIARVVVVDENQREKVYYICRATPISSLTNLNLASYRAPVGRLASLPIGAEFTLPNGSVVKVLERARLRPEARDNGWDSCGTVVEAEDFATVTIDSLRALLAEAVGQELGEDILSQLLAEETIQDNIFDGVRRSVITKMALRDQPILDQCQDEIFRLPLNSRLLILGPPGTGKTTTLIRRLGQKLDTAFLEEEERALADVARATQGLRHDESWLMFTPTRLLQLYLKEAFNKEGVPAPDRCIKTWDDFRRELAGQEFKLLRNAAGRGAFVLNAALGSLTNVALEHPTQWFDAFDKWQRQIYVQELYSAASLLQSVNTLEASDLGGRLQDILSKAAVTAADGVLVPMFGLLAEEVEEVQTLVTGLKEDTDAKIRAALNLQLNRNRSFLDELARMIGSSQQAQAMDSDDRDDADADEEEDAATPRIGRAMALKAYMQAIRAQARAAASNQPVSRSSRDGRIIEWLGDRAPSEADRMDIGRSLLVQARARLFVNPVKRYLEDMPRRYRAFRREFQPQGNWYRTESFDVSHIHPLELDIVLLALLRTAAALISLPNVLRDIDSSPWSSLKPVLGRYRNQVLVDEATDFSPIQLANMAALTHPQVRSFFACGDFNQRLTTWGTRSSEELKWAVSDLNTRDVAVSYRQSEQLNDLSESVLWAIGGCGQNSSLPAHVDSAGVAPALLEHAHNAEATISWLADRIREIERFVGRLPSTAIFVDAEDEVVRLAEALNITLAEHNIQVTACPGGQAVGQEANVRVFDVQHIKGLEFEAVFFVGIDRLAERQPTLFGKYLYVGTTRAATYLGVTCEGPLPTAIDGLREHFCQDWQQENVSAAP